MSIRSCIALIALAAGLGPVLTAQTMPLGQEFLVNTITTAGQGIPSMAMDPAGDFVVVWQSFTGAYPGPFPSLGIFGQRFDRSGAKQGAEFQVNTSTNGDWRSPAVSKDTTGNFIVAWEEASAPLTLGLPGISGRRFDSLGVPMGAVFPVTAVGRLAAVGSDGNGNFVVLWQNTGIFGQRYGNTGVPLGGQFQVNTSTYGAQLKPSVAMGPTGEFVVVWSQAYSTPAVFARLYDNAGNPQGGELEVTSIDPSGFGKTNPDAAMDAGGSFTVAWDGSGPDGDGDSWGVFVRRFDSAGVALGEKFPVNTFTSDAQWHPSVGMDASGDFVVTWTSQFQDGSEDGVFGQRFAASGRRIGSEFQLNTSTPNEQDYPSLAINASGRLAVAWLSTLPFFGGSLGVFGRIGDLEAAQPMRVDIHGNGVSSNLNGVLEPGETIQVEPTWRNTATQPIFLFGRASGLTGPAGPTYSIDDDFADYGTVQPGSTFDCHATTQNCYGMTVSGARPVSHWDASFSEAQTDGLTKTWALHIGSSFDDAPASNPFYGFIENVFHNGVTAGCGGPGYCPGTSTLRKQMAVFVLKAKEGTDFVPPPAVGIFTDVPANDPYAPWIEELFNRGVVGGCGAGPTYCPEDPVLRQQMAVFLLKTLEGAAYAPPLCAGIFGDAACPGLFTDWIEELYSRLITGGCNASPLLYCPSADVTRGQMAPFLAKTFRLLLYGP